MFPVDGLINSNGLSLIVYVSALEGAELAAAHSCIEEDERDVPFVVCVFDYFFVFGGSGGAVGFGFGFGRVYAGERVGIHISVENRETKDEVECASLI